jgi:hypothetical protein
MSDAFIAALCWLGGIFLWLLIGTAIAIRARALMEWDYTANKNYWQSGGFWCCLCALFWPIGWLFVLFCGSHPREKQRLDDEEALHQAERKFRAAIQTEKMMRRVEAEEEFDRTLLTQGRPG